MNPSVMRQTLLGTTKTSLNLLLNIFKNVYDCKFILMKWLHLLKTSLRNFYNSRSI